MNRRYANPVSLSAAVILSLVVASGYVWAESSVRVINKTDGKDPSAQPATTNRLPEIGGPADRLVSINSEVDIGKRVMHSIAAQNAFIDDPLISDYVQQLGVRLASGVFDEPPFDRIFPEVAIIDYPAINAFAAPGGKIAVFTGLFTMSESESELSSVIAHEIAHVRLRHYAQSRLKGRESTGGSVLGIIAGVLAAIANPVAGGAVLISTLAGTAQQQLEHSRQHEFEADVFGFRYLSDAGYDTQGMIAFHRRLLRLSSQNPNVEYLRTHPVSTNRISELTSRVTEDRARKPNIWMTAPRDETIFHYMKARLLSIERIESYSSLSRLPADEKVQTYLKVMRAYHEERYGSGQKQLAKLLEQEPENAVFLFTMAENLFAQKDYEEAQEYVDRLLTIYPRMTPGLLLGAACALAQSRPASAFRYLRVAENTRMPYANTLRHLDYQSEAYYQDGRLVEHHLAKADAEFQRGKYREAIHHMTSAINNRYIDAEKKERVQALLDERLAFVKAGQRGQGR